MELRQEQVAVQAAEGWAKVTRRPGVALLTAGPGVTEGIAAVAKAYLGGSPILVIGGAAPVAHWDQGALQELPMVEVLRAITKWARTVVQTGRLADYTAAAFREATAGRPGPVFLECPMDVLGNLIPTAEASLPGEGYRTQARPLGDPALVEQAAALLERAERPVIFAGTTVWWDDAAAPLRALAERLQAPVLLVGTRLDFRLNYGEPPLIPAEAKIVWLDTRAEDIGVNRGADVGIVGNDSLVMGQLDAAVGAPQEHSGWLAQVRAAEDKAREAEEALMRSDAVPIHPLRLCRELRDALDRDAYVIGDGGDIVSYGARVINAWEPGHWLDAGPMGTLGAGTGFAIATKLARPDKQVAVLFGDGAFGLNGMDMETMVRHNLPVGAVIGNDGQWAQIKHPQKAVLGHPTAADPAPG